MDMVFFTVAGASLLVRCSTKASPESDIAALQQMHQERTFDHVVLLTKAGGHKVKEPQIIPFSELATRAPALANLSPGWAI